MHIAHDMVESRVLPWLGSGCLYSSYQTDLFNSHSLEAESYNSVILTDHSQGCAFNAP